MILTRLNNVIFSGFDLQGDLIFRFGSHVALFGAVLRLPPCLLTKYFLQRGAARQQRTLLLYAERTKQITLRPRHTERNFLLPLLFGLNRARTNHTKPQETLPTKREWERELSKLQQQI